MLDVVVRCVKVVFLEVGASPCDRDTLFHPPQAWFSLIPFHFKQTHHIKGLFLHPLQRRLWCISINSIVTRALQHSFFLSVWPFFAVGATALFFFFRDASSPRNRLNDISVPSLTLAWLPVYSLSEYSQKNYFVGPQIMIPWPDFSHSFLT